MKSAEIPEMDEKFLRVFVEEVLGTEDDTSEDNWDLPPALWLVTEHQMGDTIVRLVHPLLLPPAVWGMGHPVDVMRALVRAITSVEMNVWPISEVQDNEHLLGLIHYCEGWMASAPKEMTKEQAIEWESTHRPSEQPDRRETKIFSFRTDDRILQANHQRNEPGIDIAGGDGTPSEMQPSGRMPDVLLDLLAALRGLRERTLSQDA
jgi:hypothetical protein